MRMKMGVGRSPATVLLAAGVVVVQLWAADASADEVCRFSGTTDYDGQVAVTTDVAASDGVTRVDVAVTFDSTTVFWLHVHYLIEEVSTWRAGELERVAVNSRYLLGDHIVRQSRCKAGAGRYSPRAFRKGACGRLTALAPRKNRLFPVGGASRAGAARCG